MTYNSFEFFKLEVGIGRVYIYDDRYSRTIAGCTFQAQNKLLPMLPTLVTISGLIVSIHSEMF
jgi:hypothetical protein